MAAVGWAMWHAESESGSGQGLLSVNAFSHHDVSWLGSGLRRETGMRMRHDASRLKRTPIADLAFEK